MRGNALAAQKTEGEWPFIFLRLAYSSFVTTIPFVMFISSIMEQLHNDLVMYIGCVLQKLYYLKWHKIDTNFVFFFMCL